jgi:hypothetical protein
MNYWFLSFANDTAGGACVVAGRTLADAIHRSWDLGINPGGSVIALAVPYEQVSSLPHDRWIPLSELKTYGTVISWEELLCRN